MPTFFTDLPDLGEITDNARFGGAKVGAGMFTMSALLSYVRGKTPLANLIPDVRSLGAKGDGVADDVLAFEAAAALSTDVSVPAGTYKLTRAVNPQGRAVTWRMAAGATIMGNADLLGGTVLRSTRINRQVFGNFEDATVLGLSNIPGDTRPGVTGFTADSQQASYQTRDAVVLYSDAIVPPTVFSSTAAASYTSTTAFSPTGADVSKLRVGMFVHTRHNPFFSGRLTSWSVDGKTLTVTGWFAQGNTAAGQVPPPGTPFDVVAASAAWAANFNVHLAPDSYSPAGQGGAQAHGLEVGTWNNMEPFNPVTQFPRMTGVDVIDFGQWGSYAGYAQRGQHYYGYQSYGARRVAYVVGDNAVALQGPYASPEYGFLCEAATPNPFTFNPRGVQAWTVTATGGMEMGNVATGGEVALDFHTKPNSGDFDARILVYPAGSGTEMRVTAQAMQLPRLNPTADATNDLGTPNLRWGNAWVGSLVASGNVEIGNSTTGGACAVDFHSKAGSGDYDARVQASEVGGATELGLIAPATRISGKVGFYGVVPVAKPTVTGSRGGNAALTSLLGVLASLGLITDGTTA
jgi:hypothetical protein